MARVDVTPVRVPLNGGTVSSGGTLEPDDGNAILTADEQRELLLHFNNTGDAGTILVQPGTNPPALLAGQGTLAINIGGTAELFVRLETARFMRSDGEIYIDYGTDGTPAGFVYAYEISSAGAG